jgi:phosphoribosylformylglycinamidine synthase
MKPRVLVLKTDGTNCDEETEYAFNQKGGDARTVHINQLRSREVRLKNDHDPGPPGGFANGDDVASGKILAVELISHLRDEIWDFVEAGGLVMGICNGFQTLLRTGLLPFRSSASSRRRWRTTTAGTSSAGGSAAGAGDVSPCVWINS